MDRNNVKFSTLIIAAVVIILCLISVTGATLALFTSDYNDGKIGINATAGNLVVDIVNDDENNPTSLVGEVLQFSSNDGVVVFEPGATYHTEGFRVLNDGNIPINYIIYISSDDRLEADFTEAFEVWITTNPNDLSSGVKLQEYRGENLLPQKTSEVYYLVFHMKEEADNTFQKREYTGIGITVCAIQGNVDINK